MAVTPDPHDDLYIDEKAKKMFLRKLDRWIIPPVMLLYLFSFLDRVNIGNARLYGLEEDLDLVGDQYQLAVSILFVTYILSEVPSNIALKKFTPSRWLALITAGWGVVAALTGIVQSFHGLIICRLLLGALEVVAWLSDRSQRRAAYVGFGFVSAAGYAVLLSPSPGGVKYFGCCVVAIGLYVIVGIPLVSLPSNNPRYGKRTVAAGLQVTIGNLAGIPAPFLYNSKDDPCFIVGHSVSMAMILMAMALFLTMGLWFRHVNERWASGDDGDRVEGMTEEEIAELGESNPEYRYTW
ncbi:MFS domain-containing protein [Fusarium keratoplasticum]|uniref:MFS domain-containing protein n=1 Tax=Fusarium keratoplasticum TaxID=1328300 RepID=A0ACC0QFJ9_9HYPO|nr:MFS domain-containing protein [Fusarium keratoplasticum]KAI8650985.1 MFS domain-containing protein [Fusarium keratoplasticum]